MSENLREQSKEQKTSNGVTFDSINTGSLQRIADSCEVMAKNHTELVRERDMYYKWWKESRDRCTSLERRLSAMRGVATKLKNKIKGLTK